jgi:hypothetical protein
VKASITARAMPMRFSDYTRTDIVESNEKKSTAREELVYVGIFLSALIADILSKRLSKIEFNPKEI